MRREVLQRLPWVVFGERRADRDAAHFCRLFSLSRATPKSATPCTHSPLSILDPQVPSGPASTPRCAACEYSPCIVAICGDEVIAFAKRTASGNAAAMGQAIEGRHYRYAAYKQFATELGFSARQKLPSCVEARVAQEFGQSQTGFRA
jgi:hypothetical protein